MVPSFPIALMVFVTMDISLSTKLCQTVRFCSYFSQSKIFNGDLGVLFESMLTTGGLCLASVI